jgi:hypothetical protein
VILETVYTAAFGEEAVDKMSAHAQRLIDELPLQHPIACVLFDAFGGEIARFVLGIADEGEVNCDTVEASMRSQTGASLRLVDAAGVEVEVLLLIGAKSLQ